MLDTFKQFLTDETADDMYITGAAGTGKTTGLAQLVAYCAANDIEATVCAFTHKACAILREKLPKEASICTLHSFLSKRPSINADAAHYKHVQQNVKWGETATTKILFVDEYSMVGERDLMDIRAEQDEFKVVWLGDPHQLPPVGDMQAVRPHGKYSVLLTKVYRQAADNPLMKTLMQLISFIEGAKPEPLIESSCFLRERDIVKEYKNETNDKVLLAYTNKRVQELNAEIAGRVAPEKGDLLFSPTTKEFYTFIQTLCISDVYGVSRPYGEPLLLGSKFKTLEYILKQDYQFYLVEDEEGTEHAFASIFGHYDHKVHKEELMASAASANAEIVNIAEGAKPSQWARSNAKHPLARARAKAWRDFLSFDECVICLDFAHAMTVHKSQGSTYDTVFLDTDDLAIAAAVDYKQYLKLMYVAISRASTKVITT